MFASQNLDTRIMLCPLHSKLNIHFLFSVFIISFLCFQKSIADDNDPDTLLTAEINNANYIDPFDMLNYDPVTKTSNSPEDKTVEQENELKPQNVIPVRESDAKSPQEKLSEKVEMNNDPAFVYLKRFVRNIYTTLKLEDRKIQEDETLQFSLKAVLSSRQLEILNSFVKHDLRFVKLQELDEVLPYLFFPEDERPLDGNCPSFNLDFLKNIVLHPRDLLAIIFIALPPIAFLMVLRRYSFRYIISSFITVLFTIDVYWNWTNMYQQAEAKRLSDMKKLANIPRECQPDQLNAWEKVAQFFHAKDYCEQYHEVLMTDPVYGVSIMAAFSESLAKLIFHPLEFIGDRLGNFFASILQSQFWFERYLVLAVVIVLIFVFLGFFFRYQVNFPFWLGSFQPSTQSATSSQPSVDHPGLSEIQELRNEIQLLKSSTPNQAVVPQQPSVLVLHVGSEAVVQTSTGQLLKVSRELQQTAVPLVRPSNELEDSSLGSTVQIISKKEISAVENEPENFEVLELTESLSVADLENATKQNDNRDTKSKDL